MYSYGWAELDLGLQMTVAYDSLVAGRARTLSWARLPDPPSIFLSPIFRNGRGAEGLGRALSSMAGENKPHAKEPSFLTKAYLLLYNGVLTVG